MDRRDFIKDVAVGGLLLRLSPGLFAQAQGRPDMAIVTGESPAAITREAMAAMGGIGRFIGKGDKVMIKPNIGWDRTPELGAGTNPEVVKTLVELCFEAGAKDVTVMDNTTNQAQRCYARSGIAAAAKEAGAKVPFVNPHKLKKMPLQGEWLKDWEVYTDFVEVDKLINVPVVKHHNLCRLSIGMKNWIGGVGGPRNQLHQDLDKAVVDLAAFFKPTVTVLDGYRVLMRNGPQGGRTSDVKLQKTSVVTTDPVAADAVGAGFAGVTPEELAYIPLAAARGLGRYDLEKLRVEKRTI
jgi:uncharacterized protein (DUF362 family)